MSEIIKVDAMGDPCPVPVVKAKKMLDHVTEGTVVEVHVDNEIAVQNLIKLAQSQRCIFKSGKEGGSHFVVSMWLDEDRADADSRAESARSLEQEVSCHPDVRTRKVVVIASGTMGGGNDSLGAVLMKGFLYALSQLESLPEKILFYNGGVKWTTEDSEVLEDLKSMEGRGVAILSCGTCLDYYRCADKLNVGEVTNMYSIVEAMMGADQVIRP